MRLFRPYRIGKAVLRWTLILALVLSGLIQGQVAMAAAGPTMQMAGAACPDCPAPMRDDLACQQHCLGLADLPLPAPVIGPALVLGVHLLPELGAKWPSLPGTLPHRPPRRLI
ncbi:hypothetical protein GC209_19385 [bacterium]|nr:hypothetical protein [bacterium]